MEQCNCAESITFRTIGKDVHGNREFDSIPQPTGLSAHNCEYVARRNALIKQAEDLASSRFKEGSPLWNASFRKAMNRLGRDL